MTHFLSSSMTDPAGVDGTDSWCERTISTLQGGGRRGYRIDAEGVAGGHLLVGRIRGAETTPLEWERLQGFPDNYTAPEPDSTRYRVLGNAVTVPVVEWIAKRLVEVDGRLESGQC